VVTIDCGHRRTIAKKELPRERHRCYRCPPAENTPVERAPLRDVVARGQDEAGERADRSVAGDKRPQAAPQRVVAERTGTLNG